MRIISTLSTVLATLALATMGAPTLAQQQVQQPQRPQVVAQFNDTMVRYLLADIQATHRVEPGNDGFSIYRATTGEGINFTLAPRACSADVGCQGLMLLAVFSDLRSPDSPRLDTFIHIFNDRNPTAKLIRGPNGIILLQGYINAAFGISYRNAQAQLLVFGQNIVKTSQALAAFEQQGG
ncbi:MAG: hypothetical protein ACX930_02870 [Erythrobacter sp.]